MLRNNYQLTINYTFHSRVAVSDFQFSVKLPFLKMSNIFSAPSMMHSQSLLIRTKYYESLYLPDLSNS